LISPKHVDFVTVSESNENPVTGDLKMVLQFMNATPWYTVYEGEAATETETKTGTETGTETETEVKEGDKGKEGEKKTGKVFTQEQVNAMLAENKRNLQNQVASQIKELENLKQSKNITEKERETLSSRIEELNKSLMSKEELARKNEEKLKGEHKRTVEALAAERDDWKKKFTESTITRTIMDEATQAEAFSPNQIVALLQGNTRLVEVTDTEGNVVPGQYETKVKLSDTDKDGKPTTLDLTVKEALKRMSDRNDFANLFKSGLAGGLGDSKSRTTGKEVDPSKLSPGEYRKWRKSRGW
jgi:hypothetical protein